MTLICEPELRQFVRHGQRIGLRQFVAKCYSVVECAEAEREGHAFIRLPHCDGHFVVTVAVPLVLAPGGCPQLVVGGVPYACYRRSLQRGSACREPHRRGQYQGLVVDRDGIGHARLCIGFDRYGDAPVRGGYEGLLRRACCKQCTGEGHEGSMWIRNLHGKAIFRIPSRSAPSHLPEVWNS